MSLAIPSARIRIRRRSRIRPGSRLQKPLLPKNPSQNLFPSQVQLNLRPPIKPLPKTGLSASLAASIKPHATEIQTECPGFGECDLPRLSKPLLRLFYSWAACVVSDPHAANFELIFCFPRSRAGDPGALLQVPGGPPS